MTPHPKHTFSGELGGEGVSPHLANFHGWTGHYGAALSEMLAQHRELHALEALDQARWPTMTIPTEDQHATEISRPIHVNIPPSGASTQAIKAAIQESIYEAAQGRTLSFRLSEAKK